MTLEIKLGDIIRLKKKHPCGSYDWEVVRLGADIGLKCLGCSRKIMLEPRIVERRTKAVNPGR